MYAKICEDLSTINKALMQSTISNVLIFSYDENDSNSEAKSLSNSAEFKTVYKLGYCFTNYEAAY